MILLASIIIGLGATVVRSKIQRRPLKSFRFRLEWLVFLAVIPQIAVFEIPSIGSHVTEELAAITLLISLSLLFMFALTNLKHAGMWALSSGLLCNFLVIVSNGGWMPISPDTLHLMFPSRPISIWIIGQRLGLSKDRIFLESNTILWPLSDRFIFPDWIPYRVAFSVGDILIAVGAFSLLWSLSDHQPEVS